MAEYIDRERVIEFVKNYPHYDFDSLVEELYELHTSDVIERSMIDKVIEEIKNITPRATIRTGKTNTDSTLMIPLDKVLEILEENIGE